MRRYNDDDDEFNDIFDMMDRIFGPTRTKRDENDISDFKYERLMDENNIYYTFELTHLKKEDIDIKPHVHDLILSLTREGKTITRNLTLPYPIVPSKTKVTFINGILDITVKIDKDKSNRIEIEG